MSRLFRALAIAVPLSLAVSARADLTPIANDHAVSGAPAASVGRSLLADDLVVFPVFPVLAVYYDPAASPAVATESYRTLPAAPSSAALALMALGCAGVGWLGRAANHVHSQHFEWFHPDARQVRHISVFSLDFNLPLARFWVHPDPDRAADLDVSSHPDGEPLRLHAQWFLATASARGPPARS